MYFFLAFLAAGEKFIKMSAGVGKVLSKNKRRGKMPRYQIEMTVTFQGEIEADSEAQAELLAIYDDTVFYDGVDSITITEIEEDEEEDEEEGGD